MRFNTFAWLRQLWDSKRVAYSGLRDQRDAGYIKRPMAQGNGERTRKIPLLLTVFALCLGYTLFTAHAVWAHGGGTPQLVNADADPYRIFVWTQPEPLHAGEAHVTIAVILPDPNAAAQDANAATSQLDRAVTDAEVQVDFVLPQPAQRIAVNAELIERTGIPYYEADVVLPAAGAWQTSVSVQSAHGAGEVTFGLQVLPPRVINWPLVVGGSLVVIVLLGLAIGWSRVQGAQAASSVVGSKA